MAGKKKQYEVLGACFGAGGRTVASRQSPGIVREAGLLERLRALGLSVQEGEDLFATGAEDVPEYENVRNLGKVLHFCKRFAERVEESYENGMVPIILGGDHSVSIASISAAVSHMKRTASEAPHPGVLWIDAHGDINTPETSLSGMLHGMSVAVLLGEGVPELTELCGFSPKVLPENIVYIGLRDLDPGEKEIIREKGITAYSMKEIDLLGIAEVVRRSMEQVTKDTPGYIISFDLDVCDPRVAPGVDTPVRGGITYREAHLMMEIIAEVPGLLSVGVLELNPERDQESYTIETAISLLESLFGKTIL